MAGYGAAIAELWRGDLNASLSQRQGTVDDEAGGNDLVMRDERAKMDEAVRVTGDLV